MNFFITGLPRSRTAWLANFFTYDGNFCYHELSKHTSDPKEMKILLSNRKYVNVGTSDCVFPYYYEKLLPLIENYKIVIIDRDREEVIENLKKIGIYHDKVESQTDVALHLIEKLKTEFESITVPFEKLDKIETMISIWDYLFGTKMDEDRWAELDVHNLEVNWEKYMKYFNEKEVKELMEV